MTTFADIVELVLLFFSVLSYGSKLVVIEITVSISREP